MRNAERGGWAQRISRRDLLKVMGFTGAAVALGLFRHLPGSAATLVSRRGSAWGNPATWGGRLPRKKDVVVIGHKVLLDRNVRVAGIIIKPRGELVFHPGRKVTLTSRGNVVVLGKLTMRTKREGARHRLRFAAIQEGRFKGGGMRVVPSDVGLWVMERGRLRLRGAPKLGWTRAAGAVRAGEGSLTVADEPVGWRSGDTLVITPTLPPAKGHDAAFDTSTIAAIDGRTVTLTAPPSFDHPAVDTGGGRVMTAEVLNLSRSVQVEGAPGGRSHVFIHSRVPQRIAYATIQHVGPRQKKGEESASVAGRYGLHFHHCGGGSRGSVVEGVVIRDAGGHAFVPHLSHGIRFLDCISHDTVEDGFWWDEGDETDGAVWERCVASLGRIGDAKHAKAGFLLGAGTGNVCRGCVAVGGEWLGSGGGAGYQWPSKANQKPNVWVFENNVAHNNVGSGIFVWQNDPNSHVVTDFVGYHNGAAGIFHGAYRNRYLYDAITLHRNGSVGIELHAGSRSENVPVPTPLTFRRVRIDAGGADFAVITHRHLQPPDNATRWEACAFGNYTTAGLGIVTTGAGGAPASEPDWHHVTDDCAFQGNELWIGDQVHPASKVEIQGVMAMRKDQPGALRPQWNASVT